MTFNPQVGKRYVLENGAITDPLEKSPYSDTDFPFSALIFPYYFGVYHEQNTKVYFTNAGAGIGGDVGSPLENKNPDFSIVKEFNKNNIPVETIVKTTKVVKAGCYGGVEIWNDVGDIIYEIETTYATVQNIEDSIRALEELKEVLKFNA